MQKKTFWHHYDAQNDTLADETPKIGFTDLRRREVLLSLLSNSQPDKGFTYSLSGMRDPSVVYATVKPQLQQAMDQVAL